MYSSSVIGVVVGTVYVSSISEQKKGRKILVVPPAAMPAGTLADSCRRLLITRISS